MSSIRNPYNNVGNVLPPQPFGSVVDQVKNNENALIETAGLNTYNFLDVGQELNAWNDVQKVQRAAFPINRTNEFNTDTSNKYFPHMQPLYYNGDAQNFSFNVATKKIDKLIHIINKDFDGFNNTLIEGSINTNEKELLLNGTIPYCKIGSLKINKAKHMLNNL